MGDSLERVPNGHAVIVLTEDGEEFEAVVQSRTKSSVTFRDKWYRKGSREVSQSTARKTEYTRSDLREIRMKAGREVSTLGKIATGVVLVASAAFVYLVVSFRNLK